MENRKQSDALSSSGEVSLGTMSKDQLLAALRQEQVERKKLEEALRASQVRFKELADNIDERLREQYRTIPLPTYTWQYIADEFVLIDFNDAAQESMGRIVDFVGKSASEVFADRPQVLADMQQSYANKMTVVREAPYQMVTTGESRYFVTNYVYTPPNLIITFIQDISDYKQVEAELADAKAQLVVMQWEMSWAKHDPDTKAQLAANGVAPVEDTTPLLIDFEPVDLIPRTTAADLQAYHETVPIATYFWEYQDNGLVLVGFNEAAAEATQGSIGKFVGQKADAIFERRPQVLQDLNRCYAEKMSLRREAPYKMITTEVTKYFISTYCYVEPDLVISYIQDITQYEAMRADLAQSEAQMELVCRLSAEQTLTFVNETYCWYFDRPREALIGQELPYIVEEDRDQVVERLSALTADSPIVTLEYRVKRRGNEVRWLQWIYRAIFDYNNTLVEIQAIGHDISGRKQALP